MISLETLRRGDVIEFKDETGIFKNRFLICKVNRYALESVRLGLTKESEEVLVAGFDTNFDYKRFTVEQMEQDDIRLIRSLDLSEVAYDIFYQELELSGVIGKFWEREDSE